MPGQQVANSICLKSSKKGELRGKTTFVLEFKLGPFCVTRTSFDLAAVDFGPLAISGEKVDAKFFPSDGSLFLRSVPDHLGLDSNSIFAGMLVYTAYRYDRSWVVTEGSFDSYLGSFSKTSRKGLKRRSRKLAERSGGHLDVRRYDQPNHMAMFHQDARVVSSKTFQEKLMDDGLPGDPSFCEAMRSKASDGRCYGTILYLDDEPISYLYCERQGTGWLAVYGGFDPDHAGYSPGTVHLLNDLEVAFADPTAMFYDLGPGPSSYKQFFSTHDVPCCDILILDSTLTNRLKIVAHSMLGWLTSTGIQLAEMTSLKQYLRQQIRGR